jgi:hypothetical protein
MPQSAGEHQASARPQGPPWPRPAATRREEPPKSQAKVVLDDGTRHGGPAERPATRFVRDPKRSRRGHGVDMTSPARRCGTTIGPRELGLQLPTEPSSLPSKWHPPCGARTTGRGDCPNRGAWSRRSGPTLKGRDGGEPPRPVANPDARSGARPSLRTGLRERPSGYRPGPAGGCCGVPPVFMSRPASPGR